MPWNRLADGILRVMTDDRVRDYFRGDMPIPQFFMSGDGHRNPPFQWTAAGPMMRQHFVDLMAAGRLWAHVEELPANVVVGSVPGFLAQLHAQNHIFGWELPIFQELLQSMGDSMQLAAAFNAGNIDNALQQNVDAFNLEIIRTTPLLVQVGNPANLTGMAGVAGQMARYVTRVRAGEQPQTPGIDQEYQRLLIQYHNDTMGLRTSAHPYIGHNIQGIIDANAHCTHIITCGNAHITVHNPLHGFIHLPGGAIGVVDGSGN